LAVASSSDFSSRLLEHGLEENFHNPMTLACLAIDPVLAKIPIFDEGGSWFLRFYLISFVIAVVWSVLRMRRGARKFQVPGARSLPEDPYEWAYLAGGGPRAAQLALVRLLRAGMLQWKSGFAGARVTLGARDVLGSLSAIERRMLTRVHTGKAKGVPVSELLMSVRVQMRALEVRLAAAGLRPTAVERRKACFSAILPMVLLGGVGGVKFCVGLGRERPVIFLGIGLVLTLIVACIIASRVKRLTPAGLELLAQRRVEHQKSELHASADERGGLRMISDGMALFGVTCLAEVPAFRGIYPELKTQLSGQSTTGGTDASGGGGCGGGCGSGCGGSGCGGGGGGD
jgi:uncharacterized protein (TIGR04222 family)